MVRDLHVTSPMMRGQDVLALQIKLESLGYLPGELDGEMGPTTASAVRELQRDCELVVDGVVGPRTREALATALRAAIQAPSEKGQRALAEAVRHLGEKEQPPKSNRTPFGEWFGVNGVPWCNIFVSYCFSVGAGVTLAEGFAGKGAGVYPKGCAYVPTTEAWLRLAGMWLGRVPPKPGDIAIFNWDGREPDHIGIVEEYLGDGKFRAIEGNTSVDDKSNGGEVQRTLRHLTQVDGFGRVV